MKNVFLRKQWLLLLVPVLMVGIPAACFLPPPPQAWDPARGPVVPHDTFPGECDLCHITENWQTIKEGFEFDHAAETGYPLLGAHAEASCLFCHNDRGPVAMFAKRGCAGCHEDPHDGHLGRRCKACHDQRTWTPNEMIAEHASTRFPLIGAHALTACFACHPGATVGNFQRADTDCISCHRDDLSRATEPNHVELGWRDCERCHMPTAFSDVRFGHGDDFPLTGAHRTISCDACHEGNVFTALPTDCAACHQADYNGTTDPNHVSAGFPTSCDDCHSTNPGWRPAAVNHDFFALSLGHGGLDCTACHEGGVFQGTPTDCEACHIADYNSTSDPNHASAGFPTSCDDCHSTNPGWRPAAVNHDFFALSLGHGGLDCTACHEGGVFQGTPTDCEACHIADYNSTSDPNHASAGFPTSCDDCHSTNPGWSPAAVNHDFFALTQGHAGLDCTACHEGGVFQGTPNDCAACHLADYNGTTDPSHSAAGFPTTCDTCHTTSPGWTPASFDHDFPISGGPHGALDCTDCHENPSSYAAFTCVSCHEHSQAEMADEHDEVNGYVWSSPSCLQCHPQGRE